ncbi:Murein DD-endopeptidase MepM [Buchnera aphidicola (Neophyllaphis podocarpi)]|uniref:peptidoglycan DD-metalloendopeptidase family protein n=1 Tax=Buchnera aphidicola TaxID=9 RepID=UPI003A76F2A2
MQLNHIQNTLLGFLLKIYLNKIILISFKTFNFLFIFFYLIISQLKNNLSNCDVINIYSKKYYISNINNNKKKIYFTKNNYNKSSIYRIKKKYSKKNNKSFHKITPKFIIIPTLKQYRISSNFNINRVNPITKRITPHYGVDLAMPIGTPIIATSNGIVIAAKYSISAGNYVTLRHGCKYITRYMHMKKILVKLGKIVKIGDKIGVSGNTGRSTGPHLHYEIWIQNKAVNPMTINLSLIKDFNKKYKMLKND